MKSSEIKLKSMQTQSLRRVKDNPQSYNQRVFFHIFVHLSLRECARVSYKYIGIKIQNHRSFEQYNEYTKIPTCTIAHMHQYKHTQKMYKSCLPWNGKLSLVMGAHWTSSSIQLQTLNEMSAIRKLKRNETCISPLFPYKMHFDLSRSNISNWFPFSSNRFGNLQLHLFFALRFIFIFMCCNFQ